MVYLPLHGDEEQHDEVKQQNRPEDWHVEELKEGHEEGQDDSPSACVPKFELGESSCKGSGKETKS